jgi:uncharacterized membrane protein
MASGIEVAIFIAVVVFMVAVRSRQRMRRSSLSRSDFFERVLRKRFN